MFTSALPGLFLALNWLLALSTTVLATPLTANGIQARHLDFDVKHSWPQIPNGWEEGIRPDDNHIIHLRIALKQHKFDDLVSILYEVSDPFHEKYGKHLSRLSVI